MNMRRNFLRNTLMAAGAMTVAPATAGEQKLNQVLPRLRSSTKDALQHIKIRDIEIRTLWVGGHLATT